MSEQPGTTRWTLACRDDAGRPRIHHVEVTPDGQVRLVPPITGATLWEPQQVDQLTVVLIEARSLAERRRTRDDG